MTQTDKLRVVALSHHIRPGVQQQIEAIRDSLGVWEALAARGVDVVRMCPSDDAETVSSVRSLSSDHLRVLPIPLRARQIGTLTFVPQLKRRLNLLDANVVHVIGEPWQTGVIRAALAGQTLGLPVGVHFAENGPGLRGSRGAIRSALSSFGLSRCRYVVGWSTAAAELTRSHFSYRGPVEVMPAVGVPSAFYENASRPRHEREGVLFAGRLVEEKGVLDALCVARALPPGVTLTIAGDGPLRGSIDSDSDLKSVRFLGHVSRMELSGLMGQSLVTLAPSGRGSLPSALGGSTSVEEQFGRVIAESLAAGTPVVGYDSGQVRETIGKGGAVVPPGDRQGLLEQVLRLLCDEHSWTEASVKANQQSQAYSDKVIAERLLGLWQRLGIGAKASGASLNRPHRE